MKIKHKELCDSHEDMYDEYEAWLRAWYSIAIDDLKHLTETSENKVVMKRPECENPNDIVWSCCICWECWIMNHGKYCINCWREVIRID